MEAAEWGCLSGVAGWKKRSLYNWRIAEAPAILFSKNLLLDF
jgi:hypothetical protein